MWGCRGSGGSERSGSDDIDVPLRPWAFQTLFFGSCTDIGDRHFVEAGFDSRREIAKHDLGDAAGISGGLGALGAELAIPEADRAFERAHHVTQADFGGAPRQTVAALRPALGADNPGALQVLKDLLEEARRDVLPLGDVLDLSRLTFVEKGDIEQRTHGVAALVRQLHVPDMHWHIVFVKNT